MKFIKPEDKQREEREGYSKKIVLNEKDLNNPGSHVQRLKIKAGEGAEIHHHKIQTEIFYFLDDKGYRIVNGEKIRPQAGDILVIEPNDKHSAFNDSTEDYIYLAFKIKYAQEDLYRD